MSPPVRLFDAHLARLHRARAARGFAENAFLHKRAAEDLADRLEAIPRAFAQPLFLGAPGLMQTAIAARPNVARRVGAAVFADPAAALAPRGVALDLDALPFAEERFDLILAPLILHHANDLPGALIQLRRALRPDGLLIASLFGGDTLHELRAALLEGELQTKEGAAMRVAPFADVRALGALMQRAGFALPAADRDAVAARYGDVFGLLRDLRAMGETSALADRAGALSRAALMRAAETYAGRFAGADGRVRATFEIVTLTGWAPHESQPKPLKPGSAQNRLADALGTTERPAGEKAPR